METGGRSRRNKELAAGACLAAWRAGRQGCGEEGKSVGGGKRHADLAAGYCLGHARFLKYGEKGHGSGIFGMAEQHENIREGGGWEEASYITATCAFSANACKAASCLYNEQHAVALLSQTEQSLLSPAI